MRTLRVARDGRLVPPQRPASAYMLEHDLKTFLAFMTAVHRERVGRRAGRYASSEEAVLFNAKPVVANLFEMTVPEMDATECFDNCFGVSQVDPRFRYAEGFALMDGSVPTHHAWLVDRDGKVDDPTWPAMYRRHAAAAEQREKQWSGRVVYMGFSIEAEAHLAWTLRRGFCNLLAVRDDDVPEFLERGPAVFG